MSSYRRRVESSQNRLGNAGSARHVGYAALSFLLFLLYLFSGACVGTSPKKRKRGRCDDDLGARRAAMCCARGDSVLEGVLLAHGGCVRPVGTPRRTYLLVPSGPVSGRLIAHDSQLTAAGDAFGGGPPFGNVERRLNEFQGLMSWLSQSSDISPAAYRCTRPPRQVQAPSYFVRVPPRRSISCLRRRD